ncbi:MAG: DUF177 domain-containing protein [Eubacteriales bacterium]|nr:DUF177 domain-containing protein [Eubacteriales bacterium]
MLINLYETLSVVGLTKTTKADLQEQTVSFFGEDILVKGTDTFDVHCTHTEKSIVCVECSANVCVVSSCGRCLEDVSNAYQVDIKRYIDLDKQEAYTDNKEECESISYIEDCTLDVDMLILDELYTILPMNVLCKEDCKGICKVCGTNLNKSACNCDQTVPDPRMAVFNDIFNQFKEV